ncbi:terminase large subunit [environmental Halophage eHP-3]|nr:terminase large subunit [environmental Halophage eHP-3]
MSTHSGGPTLEFDPYGEQADVLGSPARFRVVAAGRRSGKTLMAAAETVRRALSGGSNWSGYWVGAEHRHADTAFTLIDNVLPSDIVATRNQSPPRTIELVGGQTIEFHTSSGGALVSIGLDWVVCDEAGKDFPEEAWTQELRPALSDRNGEAMFISTPDGRDWFFDAYQRGQGDEYPEWASWRWATYANPHVDDSEIDSAKNQVPERIFRQEYLAEFVDESGGVFEQLDDRVFTAGYDLPGDGVDPEADHATPPFATGVDFARHHDYRVAITLDADGRVVQFDRAQGETWPEIQRVVERIYERYPGAVAVDGSRDNKIVADLEAAGVPVNPVQFSPTRKRELIENLITAVENKEVTSPEIPALRRELEIMEYDVTRGGNVRYDAPSGHHDDCCFVAGTQVMTPTGERPIKNLSAGDMVITRDGPRPIVATSKREADVITRFGLTGTPDHPIITTEGVRRLDNARESTLLYTWQTNEKPSPTTATNTTDTRIQTTGTCAPTIGQSCETVNPRLRFTAGNGKTNTGRYPMGISSTTRTGTRSTTIFPTLNVSPYRNTPNATQIWAALNPKNTCKKCLTARRSGINQTRGALGTNSTMRTSKKNSTRNDTPTNVSFAATNTKHIERRKPSTAQRSVRTNNSTNAIKKRESASSVATPSRQANTAMRSTVRKGVSIKPDRQTVYNLKVAGTPEYFANGILVHNCDALALAVDARADAARHGAAGTASLSDDGQDTDPIHEAVEQYRRQQEEIRGGKW